MDDLLDLCTFCSYNVCYSARVFHLKEKYLVTVPSLGGHCVRRYSRTVDLRADHVLFFYSDSFFFSDPLKLYYGGARIPIALLNMYCRQHSLAVYGMRLYCRMLPDGIIWHARWLFAAGEMSHSLMVCLYGISTSERLII